MEKGDMFTQTREKRGMMSLRALYKIGRGPSSSHTMGPAKACRLFLEKNSLADHFHVILYGSLAATGIGHGTDRAIIATFAPIPCRVEFNTTEKQLEHPNTMDILALENGTVSDRWRVLSVGGGEIEIVGEEKKPESLLYPLSTFREIADFCSARDMRLWQYAELCEGPGLWDYLAKIWNAMKQGVQVGLTASGTIPGGLSVQRKAKYLYSQRREYESPEIRENRMVCAFAFAVSEQNACGGEIVTAPTCGSSGVLPAVLLYESEKQGFTETQVLRALAVAGIIGNLIKTNASISGAECGCQAEIGSACSMAAAALSELLGMTLGQIEYAAEIAMEHHLGLTCDPVLGLVQIPCIERNAVAAMRAINAVSLANFLSDTRKISFDLIIQTMYETGKDMAGGYRETGESGLAKLYK